ncbi:TAXI family TRAP transporter solute-binding subunit [Candidatus Poribacteria bacterium]|nr:TAXI family TRAP transporter solute-binding subunit [Candidatus Poribacteria bacterium]
MKILNFFISIPYKSNLFFSMLYFLFIIFFLSKNTIAENGKINLATGNKTGVYYPIGNGIADAAAKANIQIKVLSSEGSIENLKWIEKNTSELCLAQSDVVYDAYNGLGKFSKRISNIRAISSLYMEAVHILIRNPLHIKKVDDMKGKRISIGPAGSGTKSNALAILEAAGVTQNEFKVLNFNFDESIKAIKENNVDVVFITSGTPSEVVNIIVQSGSAYLYKLKGDILQYLIKTYPFYIITNIPVNTYAHQDEEITTIGIPALLIGRSDLDDDIAYNLTKSIFYNTKTIAKYHPKGNNIKLEYAMRGIVIPISNGALRFYEEEGLFRTEIYKKISIYAFLIFILFILFIFILKFKKVVVFFKKRKFGRIVISLLLVWIINVLILYFAEHKFNENYSSIGATLWSGLVNLINFSSKEPFTNVGRTTSTVMEILWVAGITWLTAQLAASFVNYELRGRKKMKDHYIILNWNVKADVIIKQLISSDIEERGITIVGESSELDHLNEIDEYKSIRILKGDPSKEATLKSADINECFSVIILAIENKDNNVADAKTILILLTILKLDKDKKKSIIVEILDPHNVSMISNVVVKDNRNVEIISSQDTGAKLLSQVAVTPGLSKIYNDLLTFDENKTSKSDEIYRLQIPPRLKGHSFKELLKYAANFSHKDINLIPIAYSHEDKIIINPNDNDKLENGDYYFAIASKQNDLKVFNSYIEKSLVI